MRFAIAMATLIAGVVLTAMVSTYTFNVHSDTDALINRAQVSAEAEIMANRLDNTIANMERHGITSGHAALIFRTPENDVALDYQALKDLRDRARKISELDKASVAYQTGLDDMRGTLREIFIDAAWYSLIRNALFWIVIVDWIACAIAVIAWYVEY